MPAPPIPDAARQVHENADIMRNIIVNVQLRRDRVSMMCASRSTLLTVAAEEYCKIDLGRVEQLLKMANKSAFVKLCLQNIRHIVTTEDVAMALETYRNSGSLTGKKLRTLRQTLPNLQRITPRTKNNWSVTWNPDAIRGVIGVKITVHVLPEIADSTSLINQEIRSRRLPSWNGFTTTVTGIALRFHGTGANTPSVTLNDGKGGAETHELDRRVCSIWTSGPIGDRDIAAISRAIQSQGEEGSGVTALSLARINNCLDLNRGLEMWGWRLRELSVESEDGFGFGKPTNQLRSLLIAMKTFCPKLEIVKLRSIHQSFSRGPKPIMSFDKDDLLVLERQHGLGADPGVKVVIAFAREAYNHYYQPTGNLSLVDMIGVARYFVYFGWRNGCYREEVENSVGRIPYGWSTIIDALRSLPFDTLAKLANCDLEKIGIERLTDIKKISADPDTGEIISLKVARLFLRLSNKREQLKDNRQIAHIENIERSQFEFPYEDYLDAGGKPDATFAASLFLSKNGLKARVDELEREKQDLQTGIEAKEQENSALRQRLGASEGMVKVETKRDD